MDRNKEKHDKFVSIADRRINNVASCIRRLRSLANQNSYIYSDKEIQSMFNYLRDELDATESVFLNNGKLFTFDDCDKRSNVAYHKITNKQITQR